MCKNSSSSKVGTGTIPLSYSVATRKQVATNKKPADTRRCANIKATIWKNTREKGPFFATTCSRSFKDQSGKWQNRTSLGLNDLETLMNVAIEAKKWMAAHVFKR
jgi:hypothetical protein